MHALPATTRDYRIVCKMQYKTEVIYGLTIYHVTCQFLLLVSSIEKTFQSSASRYVQRIFIVMPGSEAAACLCFPATENKTSFLRSLLLFSDIARRRDFIAGVFYVGL